MESMFPLQENLGSMVLLTNKTTQMSSNLLTLASPRPRRTWVCRNMSITVPSIGTVWYLPVSWLFHIYLVLNCIRELDITENIHFLLVVQVLLAISVALMILFTASALVKVGHPSVTLNSVCTYQSTSLKHIKQAVRSQKYSLQALSAFILMNSYLLLQHSHLAMDSKDKTTGNDTVHAEWSRVEANISVGTLLPLPAAKLFTYLAFCVHFAVPLIIYSIQESEPVWQKKYLWGFFYSFILLLSAVKYLSSALTFHVVSLGVSQTSKSLLFQGVSIWLPVLYVISALSLFLYLLSLKIYLEMSFKTAVPDSPAANVTLRKIRLYPSPLGVILTAFIVVVSEVPFLLHLCYLLLLDKSKIFIVYLLVVNTGFCLLCFSGCLIIGLRKRCRTNKPRIKQKRIDSGVCLANSFVYQSSPETAKAKC